MRFIVKNKAKQDFYLLRAVTLIVRYTKTDKGTVLCANKLAGTLIITEN